MQIQAEVRAHAQAQHEQMMMASQMRGARPAPDMLPPFTNMPHMGPMVMALPPFPFGPGAIPPHLANNPQFQQMMQLQLQNIMYNQYALGQMGGQQRGLNSSKRLWQEPPRNRERERGYLTRPPRETQPREWYLMCNRERDWVIKIQLLQMHTDNPFLENYYYLHWKDREQQRKELEKEREKEIIEAKEEEKETQEENNSKQAEAEESQQPAPPRE